MKCKPLKILALFLISISMGLVEMKKIKTTVKYYQFLQLNANMTGIRPSKEEEGEGHSKTRRWVTRSYHTAVTEGPTRKVQFKPVIKDKTCLLIPDIGPCRGKISTYFFDPNNMNCSVFLWGGCQGNGNRFDRLSDCLDTCLSSPGYFPHRPRYCLLTFDYGWCFGAEERWYYDFRWKVCKKTIYSGCGGNKNNFYNREQCDHMCRFGSTSGLGEKKPKIGAGKKVMVVDPPYAKTKAPGRKLNVLRSLDEFTDEPNRGATRKDYMPQPIGLQQEHLIPNAKDQNLTDDKDLHNKEDLSLEIKQILGK